MTILAIPAGRAVGPSDPSPVPGLGHPASIPIALADFLATQERLGEAFERVLFENLWDLYAR